MANKGHYIERNGTERAAGLPSFGLDKVNFKDFLVSADPMELMHRQLEEQLRLSRTKPMGKPTPFIPLSSIGEIFSTDLEKSNFVQLQEDKNFKAGRIAQIAPTHSKPDHVTNCSRTFGRVTPPGESLYNTIMPKKSAEQVNREYAAGIRPERIVNKYHYFPSEQINRRYTKPFDRFNTFGKYLGAESSGSTIKRCLEQSGDQLTVVTKPWKDYVERTSAPLGKKYGYLYKVPDLNFGAQLRQKCNMKMLLENASPREQDDTLVSGLSYLNQLRHSLHNRNNFDMFDLIAMLERNDKEHSGHMPLSQIQKIMWKLHIGLDTVKIRTMLSHFRLIIDEGRATERVNYHHFCRLLCANENLPDVGHIGIVPDNMYNKETTYRQFTSDRTKKPNEGLPIKWPHRSPDQEDDANANVSEIITPKLCTTMGLGPSEFKRLREKAQMERIFENTVAKEKFEEIWERLMVGNEAKEPKEQDEMASVAQFRDEMIKYATST